VSFVDSRYHRWPGEDHMETHRQRGFQQADSSAKSVARCSDHNGVVADDSAVTVTTDDVAWPIARLRAMVTPAGPCGQAAA
jgi:hypothetical protein